MSVDYRLLSTTETHNQLYKPKTNRTMAIIYSIQKCRNPRQPDVDYFAPRVKKIDDYGMKDLVRDVNDATGMSEIDVYGVLYALNKQITKALLSGRTVVLEGVGRLYVGIKAKCFPKEVIGHEEFSPSAMIRGVHINFRPDAEILRELRSRKSFRRISSEWMA